MDDIAVLPCNVTPIGDDKITLVIWFKNGSSLPVYSVDMRDSGKPEFADHYSDSKIMGGRGFFNFEERSLVIEHVKRVDEGYYKCRVDYKQTPTRNFEIQLIVVIPVEKVTILEAVSATQSTTKNTTMSLHPVIEGSPLSATCVAIGGNPYPQVIWIYENETLDDTYEVFSEREVRNIFWIDHILRNQLDRIVTCQARNSNLFPPISVSASISLYLPPEDTTILGQNKDLSAGHMYEITCEVKGSRPAANITWWKDSFLLRGPFRYSFNESQSKSVSIISFVPTETDSGKTISCEAINPMVPHHKKRDSWKLIVNYRPVVTIALGSNLNSSSITEGSDVYFECIVKAVPRIYKIRWIHNDVSISNNVSQGVIISNQTLVLQSIKRNKAGVYQCAATNSEGETISQSFYLDIKYEPICSESQQKIYGAARNEEIKITCKVNGNPPPNLFRWSFNNSMVHITPLNTFTSDNGTSIISYKPTSELQYGTLLCTSKNELGPQVVPCTFHIVSAGRPDAPNNCSIENKTQTWLHVKCAKGFDGGLPQEFVCEVRHFKTDKIISNISSKLFPEFRITGLELGTDYQIVIYSRNIKGRSKITQFQVTTLSTSTHQHRRVSENDKLSLKSPIWMKITAGSVVLLLLLICVIFSLFRVTRKRCKKRDTADGEEIQKCPLSQSGSLSHSDDEKNPDLIPQNTNILCPVISSINVETSTSELELSTMQLWNNNPSINSRAPKLLEANKLEELVGWSGSWPSTSEPIMLVIPESLPVIQKQNAETQTSSFIENRKESAV